MTDDERMRELCPELDDAVWKMGDTGKIDYRNYKAIMDHDIVWTIKPLLLKIRAAFLKLVRENDQLRMTELIVMGMLTMTDHSKEWDEAMGIMIDQYKKGKRGVELTEAWDEHPEGYDFPCICKLCKSYS